MNTESNSATMLSISVVHAMEHAVETQSLSLPQHATVADALALCQLAAASVALANMRGVDHSADSLVGVWGKRVLLNTPLQNGDRIELYRPLIADAKSARLKRASEQGYRWQGRTRRAAK